jgi:hypothetical protein
MGNRDNHPNGINYSRRTSLSREPPADIRAEIELATQVGGRLELQDRHLEAFEVFRRVYEKVLGAQPRGRRFHKGEPLANMGWVRHRSGDVGDGAKWTALAFIEDALSRAEELPGILDELSRPAAQNLRTIGADDGDLYDLALAIRAVVAAGEVIPDPLVLFLRLGFPDQIRTWLGRRPGASLRIRVFVSSPNELRTERRLIAEICRELTLTMPAHVEALLWEGAGARNPEAQSFPPEITGAGGQGVIDDHIWNGLHGLTSTWACSGGVSALLSGHGGPELKRSFVMPTTGSSEGTAQEPFCSMRRSQNPSAFATLKRARS